MFRGHYVVLCCNIYTCSFGHLDWLLKGSTSALPRPTSLSIFLCISVPAYGGLVTFSSRYEVCPKKNKQTQTKWSFFGCFCLDVHPWQVQILDLASPRRDPRRLRRAEGTSPWYLPWWPRLWRLCWLTLRSARGIFPEQQFWC